MTCSSYKCSKGRQDWINSNVIPKIREGMWDMILSNKTLKNIASLLLDNIERGLRKATNPTAVVKCYPTYVQDLPDGTEKGKYLALDLGGSKFRVLMIELDGDKFNIASEIYTLSNELITGSGYDLFDYIAGCLSTFAKQHKVENDNLPLGFTYSFPASQTGLTKALIVKWTKGFNCKDVIGQDACELLMRSINKLGDVKIDVVAILNDTTGTLMSCAFKNPNARIGMIIGTGNNACYIEKQSNAELFGDADMGSGQVVINLECGAFGEDNSLEFVRTDVDREVDSLYPNQGKQLHEKMISGMYLGEISRRYIMRFVKMGLLFGGKVPPQFEEQDCFTTSFISEIESDQPGIFKFQRQILQGLGFGQVTDQDCTNVRFICECVTRRAAHLASTTLVTLIHKMGVKNVIVGIDGSLYKYHPHFRRLMLEKMKEICDPSYTYDLVLSEDGSGIGAALVAAVADRKKKH